MTSVVSRAGAVVLAVLALVLTTLGVATVPAAAQPTSEDPQFLRLSIDEVTPTMVSITSPPVVAVTGTVTNVGDRDVDDVWVRLQRAPVVSDSAALRTSLSLDQAGFDTVGEFEKVSDSLGKGERTEFTVEMPLRSELVPSLNIDSPGVYPLLVNINGVPEYGGQARLDDARFLLPVLGVPASTQSVSTESESTESERSSGSASPTESLSGRSSTSESTARRRGDVDSSGVDSSGADSFPALTPDLSRPVAVSMLWPLADIPRLASGVPGSATEPVRLVDDELATSLAEGGRLDGLLRAVEQATEDDPRIAMGLCLAVDPDLLVTVTSMTRAYLVVDDPADPTGEARPGTGSDAAAAWLDRLRTLASSMCTMAVPFAQTDLTALADLDAPSLTLPAVESPSTIVDSILGTTSLPDVVWPDSGVLTENTGLMVASGGPVTVLLADTAVENDRTTRQNGVRVSGVDGLTAGLFDSSVSAALAGMGDAPSTPSFVPKSARYDLTDDSATARMQDALGAMAWPALVPSVNSAAGEALPPAGRSVLFAPPQTWSVSPDEASATLSMISTLMRSGLATTRPVDAFVAAAADRVADPTASVLTYPEQAVADGAPASVIATAAEQIPRLDTLQLALIEDPQAQLTPQRFMAPLREDLLRAMTLAGLRGDHPDAAARTAELRATEVRNAVDTMFAGVTVLSPGGVYTLTSEQSPLLLVARNDLPVGITVRLHVDAPAAMEITDIGPTQLPPRGSRTLTVPAQISDSRKLGVEFSLATEAGLPLGSPTNVTVRSNAYGQILAIVTGCAGALLLFLAGRRLLHRFRGEPDPADEGYERQ